MRATNILRLTFWVFMGSIFAVNANNPIIGLEGDEPLVLHREYFEEVYKNSSVNASMFLSNIISKWDVKDARGFEEGYSDYEVMFRTNKGIAYVNYDGDGNIIDAKKQFRNIALSRDVIDMLRNDYPEWRQFKNRYVVTYKKGFDVRKSLILFLEKGEEKKKIRLRI